MQTIHRIHTFHWKCKRMKRQADFCYCLMMQNLDENIFLGALHVLVLVNSYDVSWVERDGMIYYSDLRLTETPGVELKGHLAHNQMSKTVQPTGFQMKRQLQITQ